MRNPRAVIKIDCAEFQHSHEIAKLIGSPPGYLGHRETHPLLSQEVLNQYHTDACKLSFVLFDEIEDIRGGVFSPALHADRLQVSRQCRSQPTHRRRLLGSDLLENIDAAPWNGGRPTRHS